MPRALNIDHCSILIVEDELILAEALRVRLEKFGYRVVGHATTSEESIRLAQSLMPDLVLMDIQLAGEGNGIQAGTEIRNRHDIPIVFLTAFTDRETLERAKAAEPFGYLAKPIKTETLRTTVEIALHKSRVERDLRKRERWLTSTPTSIYDAFIATDEFGMVTFLNPLAAQLTGWSNTDSVRRPIDEVLVLIDRTNGEEKNLSLARSALLEGHVQPFPVETVCRHRRGDESRVTGHAAPVRDLHGNFLGAALVFRLLDYLPVFRQIGKMVEGKEFVVTCASCKNIRDDEPDPSWIPVEHYLERRFDILFSHGICPDCFRRLYPNHGKYAS